MRIARVGEIGQERPAVLVGEDAIFVDSLIPDWDRQSLSDGPEWWGGGERRT